VRIPVSWIKEYVNFDVDPEELSRLLTMAGLETVNPGSEAPDIDGVLTAVIDKIEPHPDADKLTVCKVRAGEDEEPRNVVCGAPNIKEGDVVPLALPNTTLPSGMKLKKSKIRGIVSEGMMCSERELGVSDDHSGIWILPPGTPIGKTLPEALGEKDQIIETEPTPNRGDLMSVVGTAREVAAALGEKVRFPSFKVIEEGPPAAEFIRVDIEDYDACPRYVARLIRNVTIGPSPKWMAKRLEAAGMRPINNVVDATNYVMLELGQPLHAFDYNKLRQKRIVVKNARAGEKFTTLDGEEHELREDTLMICDGEGPVAIAGVMGGLESEVSEDTKDVLLESAYFKPTSVRRTARLLGIPTEASKRFDKGVDPLGTLFAADRAIELMRQTAGGEVAKGALDANNGLWQRKKITLRPERCNRILGTRLSPNEQTDVLQRLDGMELAQKDDKIEVLAPSYRPDLMEEYDLIEEVARLIGYNEIKPTMPTFKMETMREKNDIKLARKIRERMCAIGFSEALITSFEDPDRLGRFMFPEGDSRLRTVKLANPLSENESILRTTLLPRLIAAYVMNRNKGVTDAIRLYEINAAFENTGEELPCQRTMIAGIMAGPLDKVLWDQACPEDGFYEVKGVVEHLLAAVEFPGARIKPMEEPEPFVHPGKAAKVMVGPSYAGFLGQLHPEAALDHEIDHQVFIFELNFDMLAENAGRGKKAAPVSKYPPTLRDIAVVVDESVTMEHIIAAAGKMRSPLLWDMSLFDVFTRGSVPEGKKSMAFHVRYQSLERTLTDDEVNKEHQKLAEQLKRETGAVLR